MATLPLERNLFQAILTLKLMQLSRINLLFSAWEVTRGEFDMNATPIAPAGTTEVIHEKPNGRGWWDAHSFKGFYLGPAMLHYRRYTY